jgi:hypothetical protein
MQKIVNHLDLLHQPLVWIVHPIGTIIVRGKNTTVYGTLKVQDANITEKPMPIVERQPMRHAARAVVDTPDTPPP